MPTVPSQNPACPSDRCYAHSTYIHFKEIHILGDRQLVDEVGIVRRWMEMTDEERRPADGNGAFSAPGLHLGWLGFWNFLFFPSCFPALPHHTTPRQCRTSTTSTTSNPPTHPSKAKLPQESTSIPSQRECHATPPLGALTKPGSRRSDLLSSSFACAASANLVEFEARVLGSFVEPEVDRSVVVFGNCWQF